MRQLLSLPLVALLSLAACAEPPPPVVPQAAPALPPTPPPPRAEAPPPPPPVEKPALPPEYADVVIKVEKVAGTVYLLEGKGGNIGVSVGDDGVVLVDDQFAPLAPKIQEALKGITDKPVRVLLNTHWHGDHTGGNAAIGAGGATIVAHDNVRTRMAAGAPGIELGGKPYPATPPASMELPPKKIWQIVSDCAHYKEHLPSIASSELLKRSGNVDTCKVTYSMPFPFSNLTGVTESVDEVSEARMVRRWKHVSGDYRVNDGSWEVKALNAAGTSSLVTYTLHVDPAISIPDFIRNNAQKKTLPEILRRIRAEAAKLP